MSLGWIKITCCNCAVPFAIEGGHYNDLKGDSNRWFYCPNGHKQHFTDSEADRLRRERDRLAQQIAQKNDALASQRQHIEHTEHRLRATKGVVTRYRNRVGNGVCPCCNRTFDNLARHMQSQHPTFKAEAAE